MQFQGGKIVSSRFSPHGFIKNQHLQTLWPTLFRKRLPLVTHRERLITSDEDFIDIDWYDRGFQPLILVIHGLASSSEAKYVKGLQQALSLQGFSSVAMNLRGCSGEPNNKSRNYHGGVSDDLHFVIDTLRTRFPDRPLGAVGFSLGGNILLKWLAETSQESHLFAALSVSAPLQLNLATEQLQKGFSKIYEQYLLSFLKRDYYKKLRHLVQNDLQQELLHFRNKRIVWAIKSIAEFDEHLTAPLHGFTNAHHYYATCSARPLLKRLRTPTLILHAKDDPFMPPEVIPSPSEISSLVMIELSEHGGHVGFIASDVLGNPYYWLEKRIPDFFQQQLQTMV